MKGGKGARRKCSVPGILINLPSGPQAAACQGDLGVEGFRFGSLAEHRHGEDQPQNLSECCTQGEDP